MVWIQLRINRYLARCGVGSRRSVEALVSSGRVAVNGTLVQDLAFSVEDGDLVTLDGAVLRPLESVYIVMNKPCGVVCAVRDSHYRTVLDLLPIHLRRLSPFPVGRLDRDSQGLLILTNDGDFCQRVLHPTGGIIKAYQVFLSGNIRGAAMERMRKGVWSDGEFLKPFKVEVIGPRMIWVELQEGKNREIRRMVASVGLEVVTLTRRRIGGMELRELPSGGFALFSLDEIWHHINVGGIV